MSNGSAIAREPLWVTISTEQSSGMRACTKARKLRSRASGSWSSTRRNEILALAFAAMTVFVPSPV